MKTGDTLWDISNMFLRSVAVATNLACEPVVQTRPLSIPVRC